MPLSQYLIDIPKEELKKHTALADIVISAAGKSTREEVEVPAQRMKIDLLSSNLPAALSFYFIFPRFDHK